MSQAAETTQTATEAPDYFDSECQMMSLLLSELASRAERNQQLATVKGMANTAKRYGTLSDDCRFLAADLVR